MAVPVSILAASLVLEHVPDLVVYGSKPLRERERLPELRAALRTYEDVCAYAPHQVFIGARAPEELWEIERPRWSHADRRESEKLGQRIEVGAAASRQCRRSGQSVADG